MTLNEQELFMESYEVLKLRLKPQSQEEINEYGLEVRVKHRKGIVSKRVQRVPIMSIKILVGPGYPN